MLFFIFRFIEIQKTPKVITTATIEFEKREKIETKSVNNGNKSIIMNGNFESQIRKRNVKSSSKVETVNPKTDSSTQHEPNLGIFGKTLKTIKDSRLIQVLLGFTGLLILSLIFITLYLDDSPQNNWRRMFGPQLDYVNGPPPS